MPTFALIMTCYATYLTHFADCIAHLRKIDLLYYIKCTVVFIPAFATS